VHPDTALVALDAQARGEHLLVLHSQLRQSHGSAAAAAAAAGGAER
jgi:hypothetical protein